jgi:hypothetical protein
MPDSFTIPSRGIRFQSSAPHIILYMAQGYENRDNCLFMEINPSWRLCLCLSLLRTSLADYLCFYSLSIFSLYTSRIVLFMYKYAFTPQRPKKEPTT